MKDFAIEAGLPSASHWSMVGRYLENQGIPCPHLRTQSPRLVQGSWSPPLLWVEIIGGMGRMAVNFLHCADTWDPIQLYVSMNAWVDIGQRAL